MYSDAGILSQRSLSNDYNTQDGLYNNSNGQSGKNRGSKFHVHTLPVKNSFYHSVSQQPWAMKMFTLDMRFYEFHFTFLINAKADPFF